MHRDSAIALLALGYLCGVRGFTTGAIFPDRRPVLLPVLHNLEADWAEAVLASLPMRTTVCSVSFRHERAVAALHGLVAASSCEAARDGKERRIIGASTVCSEHQVRQAKEAGAEFISTMFYSERVQQIARSCELPVLGGVVTQVEARKSIASGISSLKFYPSSAVTPEMLADILNALGDKVAGLDVIVAGGVRVVDVKDYFRAGATGFAIGIDCLKFQGELHLITKLINSYYSIMDEHSLMTYGVQRL